MENASKALLIAGGVLIGVLIISLAVYLFADFGSKSASINAQNSQKQLSAFNSKFTSYQNFKDQSELAGTKTENEIWKITIYDIITVKGYALENNEKYENADEKIDVKIGGRSILSDSDINLINLNVKSTGEVNKFRCEDNDVQYNQNGKVKSINFKAI